MDFPALVKDRSVCVIGLGYVGLTLAVAMADTGFRVHGVEIREDVLNTLKRDKAHFWEPRLNQKLARVRANGNFTFSNELSAEVDATVYIITVGTPLDATGRARVDAIRNAAAEVAGAMKDGALVILRSTVKLGTARNEVTPVLRGSGKKFEIASCPERTLEGKALIELHELPQIVGADDAETRFRCVQLFNIMTPTTVQVSTLETAELVKLVDNTYRDVTFAFANEVAKLCGHSGISAREVIRAGRLAYPRTAVALPGPVGGPCLEKDPHILIESAQNWGVELPITAASRRTNEEQPGEIAGLLKAKTNRLDGFSETPRICVMGLAFKGMPPTDDLRGTMAKPIIDCLRQTYPRGHVVGYDAVAQRDAIESCFGIEVVDTIEAGFEGADIVLIANNHPDLSRMDLAFHAESMNSPGVIYDIWNMHDDIGASMPNDIVGMALGAEKKE